VKQVKRDLRGFEQSVINAGRLTFA